MEGIDLSDLPPEIQAFVRYLEGKEWAWVDESDEQGPAIRLIPDQEDRATGPLTTEAGVKL